MGTLSQVANGSTPNQSGYTSFVQNVANHTFSGVSKLAFTGKETALQKVAKVIAALSLIILAPLALINRGLSYTWNSIRGVKAAAPTPEPKTPTPPVKASSAEPAPTAAPQPSAIQQQPLARAGADEAGARAEAVVGAAHAAPALAPQPPLSPDTILNAVLRERPASPRKPTRDQEEEKEEMPALSFDSSISRSTSAAGSVNSSGSAEKMGPPQRKRANKGSLLGAETLALAFGQSSAQAGEPPKLSQEELAEQLSKCKLVDADRPGDAGTPPSAVDSDGDSDCGSDSLRGGTKTEDDLKEYTGKLPPPTEAEAKVLIAKLQAALPQKPDKKIQPMPPKEKEPAPIHIEGQGWFVPGSKAYKKALKKQAEAADGAPAAGARKPKGRKNNGE